MEWIPTADRMPPNGTPVLADTGHKHPIRACWVAKFSEEVVASDFDGDEDYDEKTDASYWPEGWYEWNRYEETHWRVDVPVTHWMALPLPFNVEIQRVPKAIRWNDQLCRPFSFDSNRQQGLRVSPRNG